MDEDFLGHDIEFAGNELLQAFRHVVIEFEADHDAATTTLERRLEKQHKIFGLFLDLDFAVAHDPEHALTRDGITRKQAWRFHGDQRFERNETHLARA